MLVFQLFSRPDVIAGKQTVVVSGYKVFILSCIGSDIYLSQQFSPSHAFMTFINLIKVPHASYWLYTALRAHKWIFSLEPTWSSFLASAFIPPFYRRLDCSRSLKSPLCWLGRSRLFSPLLRGWKDNIDTSVVSVSSAFPEHHRNQCHRRGHTVHRVMRRI